MVVYKCDKCIYQTKDRNKYYRHLRRKFSCKDSYPSLDSDEKSMSVPKTFHGVPSEQKELPICKWCHRNFSRQPNLNKHLKYGHCMIKRQWLNSMDAEYKRLLKEMKENQTKLDEFDEIDGESNKNEIEKDDKLSKSLEICILEES